MLFFVMSTSKTFCIILALSSLLFRTGHSYVESGPSRGVISRLGEVLEQETQLEDRLVEVVNQQEIKENLDSVGLYVGLIGTGLSAGLGTILGNTEQIVASSTEYYNSFKQNPESTFLVKITEFQSLSTSSSVMLIPTSFWIVLVFSSLMFRSGHSYVESGPSRGVISRLGEVLEQETQLEDRLVEVVNQQEIKETLDSVGHYVGLIGTGLSAGLGTILGNVEQVIKSLQK
ncbi:hypothetical protein JTE90_001636 [Oedothorax gibbosus]|uniref:Uncharacterized protein n=1 Tax=Oedothorax gibbosus TaxID=931172 RepID=A0AAV6VLN8_9ARAC|nr:hypothetical protein JTE90_001636 [Oedothorax gibbosus]